MPSKKKAGGKGRNNSTHVPDSELAKSQSRGTNERDSYSTAWETTVVLGGGKMGRKL